ncbi:hypothetical protein PLICRDRAFT_41329 [Plicaturopsis crispa FD-325 SS-3]|nr:hypothetical protein PLICRDRAFT_41329 [Plicaturopsis crispa FD-325 SS-3]
MVAASYSPVHSASLVDPATHSPELLELVDLKLSRPVIDYAIDCVVEAVDFAMGRPSSSSRGRSLSRHTETSKFSTFVHNVLTRAEITTPVLLAALVYIDRARPHLHIALEEWACERVFLGAVMVASKYLNDSTLKNVHWALCTGVFGKRDVGRIEREFLDVLDFELGITEADVLSHHDSLSALTMHAHAHRRSHHHHHHHVAASHVSSSTSFASSQTSSPRKHHAHARHASEAALPELEASSPQQPSTPGSASPRTPDTLVEPPLELTKVEPPHVEVQVAPRRHFLPSMHELLRSFPIPHHCASSHLHAPSRHSHPVSVNA